jgi:MerR family transcriptional regulator/heat shock protein HspR
VRLQIDDPRAPVFTIGQVSEMLHVTQAFLRRLDQEGVVAPARSEGGQRRYSRDQINLVAQVRGLVAEGLTLAGARRVIELEARVAELEAELERERSRHGRDRDGE